MRSPLPHLQVVHVSPQHFLPTVFLVVTSIIPHVENQARKYFLQSYFEFPQQELFSQLPGPD